MGGDNSAKLLFRKPDPVGPRDWTAELAKRFPEAQLPNFWSLLQDNCNQWALEVGVSPLWRTATSRLQAWRQDYRRISGTDLLTADVLPPFVGKGAPRIQQKVVQVCEKQGSLEACFSTPDVPVPELNDLVRTRIACKYMDGVEFLTTHLFGLAEELGCDPKRMRQGKLEGYFAQHLTFTAPVIFRVGGAPKSVTIRCEVQVATELSTRVWEAAHGIYEHARVQAESPDEWQWNPTDPRFISRQLGHMVHLADGLLIQLRDSMRKA